MRGSLRHAELHNNRVHVSFLIKTCFSASFNKLKVIECTGKPVSIKIFVGLSTK